MNLDKLKAAFTKNRVALGALGVAAVAALAWRARTAGAGDAASSDAQAPAGTSATPSYYTPGAAYDSTATDIYNAIQPQLEELREIASQIPVPGTPTKPDDAPVSTNAAWLKSAIEGWSKAGKNPIDIQHALTSYLQGRTINSAQAAGVQWAVKQYGAAPEGTTGVSKIVPVTK